MTVLGEVLMACVLVLSAGIKAIAQALPTAEAAPISTGFALPTVLGSLQYAISASQSLGSGYYGSSGIYSSTNLTGDLAYLSNSKEHPFSMILSGGHSFSESGQASYSFADLGFSQVASIGKWNGVLSDNISYLPGTPAAGLSGIPGVGDLGVNPVQVGSDTGQGVLTNFSNRVTNTVAASVQRQLTAKTSLNASGSYGITRFLDSSITGSTSSSAGLDSDAYTGGAGIGHQVDARNSFGGNYSYSKSTYSGNNFGVVTPGFVSQTVSASYTHQFSRRFTMGGSAGPQFISLNSAGSGTSISLYANGTANYAGRSTAASLAFTRSTNSGYGLIGGAISNAISAGVSHRFADVWNCSATAGYSRSSNLPVTNIPSFSANTYVEGIQISRAFTRSLSGFASYTLEDQSFSGSSTVDVFSGLSQVVGFGITFSPSALHLGRQ